MKFLVDAQLPRRFCNWLQENGHDAVHTLDLELGNETPDSEIILLADRDGRIVVTKDDDFVQSFLLRNTPQRLLLVASGNIGNTELERLIITALPTIAEAFETAHYIEISKDSLIIHE
jgi:predicted nuclease of predicted toxin-antitoxin system